MSRRVRQDRAGWLTEDRESAVVAASEACLAAYEACVDALARGEGDPGLLRACADRCEDARVTLPRGGRRALRASRRCARACRSVARAELHAGLGSLVAACRTCQRALEALED